MSLILPNGAPPVPRWSIDPVEQARLEDIAAENIRAMARELPGMDPREAARMALLSVTRAVSKSAGVGNRAQRRAGSINVTMQRNEARNRAAN